MVHKIKTQVFLKIFSVFLFVLLLGAYASTFALFDGNPYAPGSTLDPECAPTDTNCKVLLTSSAPSQWLDSSNGIYYTNGNVGIGTNTSSAALTVKGIVTASGPELISNGNFDTDATGWNLYDTGSYDNGKLTVNYTGVEDWADVSTEFEVESGKTYLVSFTLSGVANDEVYYWFDNIHTGSYPTFTDGDNYSIFTSDYTGTETIYFELWDWNDNSTFSIDNISIKEVAGGVSPSLEVYNYDNKKILSLGGNNLNNFFVGDNAGSGVTFVTNSNFIGNNAGSGVTFVTNSNFLGNNAGSGATSAFDSNFLGTGAGYNATSANNSNFLGQSAGSNATSASYSNFLGVQAGYNATSASSSNFIGNHAGYNASASSSNFIGSNAGYNASASSSNFIGSNAGVNATSAYGSNFLGNGAGANATSAYGSNFIGQNTGAGATSASNSNFIGNSAGAGATSAYGSNFLGNGAGDNATSASNSNFIGNSAGAGATSAYGSNFLGNGAGDNATSASYSNFLGSNAGVNATSASGSNFLGNSAGFGATSASNSNFIGNSAGANATSAYGSNFIGQNTGAGATYASNSSFLGSNAGASAINASNSVFIGQNAGAGDAVNNTGNSENFSILIGKSTSTGGFSNSIAIGGSAANTASNQLSFGSSNRPINKLYIAGLNYDLPTSHGSAGNVLTNNGNGVLTWSSASGGGLTSNADYNTLGGTNAGLNLVSGAQYNTFLGYEAGLSSATLSTNIADYNTAIGYRALYSNTTGYNNTANGSYSLYSNTTGGNNTANGSYSLYSNTTGYQNIANGYNSLYSNTTGRQNTANGSFSLDSNTTGSYNTANGNQSLRSNTTGSSNTANGFSSLYLNTTGNYNTANGSYSLHYSGRAVTAGSFITGVSYTIITTGTTNFTLCGASNSTAGTVFTATGPCSGTGTASSNSNNNVAEGYNAGRYIANGSTALNASSNSIFLGADTKALQDGSNNEIVLGYNATGHGSNTATWGATTITNHYFSGNVQYTSYGAGTLTTDANGNITASSDERLKNIIGYYDNKINNTDSDTNNTETDEDTNNTDDINTNNDIDSVITEKQKSALERIMEINPIIYKWNEKSGLETEHEYVGFSAQNLQLAIPEAVGLDKRIDPETGENYLTISDRPILATVVNAIKEMNLKVKSFEDFEAEENTLRDNLGAWLANATNKITRIFTGEICLTDGSEEGPVCLNASELRELKESLNTETNLSNNQSSSTQGSTGSISNGGVVDLCPNINETQIEIPEKHKIDVNGDCILINEGSNGGYVSGTPEA